MKVKVSDLFKLEMAFENCSSIKKFKLAYALGKNENKASEAIALIRKQFKGSEAIQLYRAKKFKSKGESAAWILANQLQTEIDELDCAQQKCFDEEEVEIEWHVIAKELIPGSTDATSDEEEGVIPFSALKMFMKVGIIQ